MPGQGAHGRVVEYGVAGGIFLRPLPPPHGRGSGLPPTAPVSCPSPADAAALVAESQHGASRA